MFAQCCGPPGERGLAEIESCRLAQRGQRTVGRWQPTNPSLLRWALRRHFVLYLPSPPSCVGCHMPDDQRNVFGEQLEVCSLAPRTGFYRTGCCDTGAEDFGIHTVCVEVTTEFLAFSKSRGNDLSSPLPEFGFPGLKPGDRWC